MMSANPCSCSTTTCVVEKTSAEEFSNALQNFAQSIRTARQMMTPDADAAEDLQDLAAVTTE